MRLQDEIGLFESLSSKFTNLFGATDPLSQSAIDSCGRAVFKNSTDIKTFFSRWGGFIPWYNATLAETPAFASRRSIDKSAAVADHFEAFWNYIPEIYGTPSITGIEFSALMCIGIQECSGDLYENPETIDHPPNHPGLTYAFDALAKKASYNVNKGLGQWPAGNLFANHDFTDAHHALLPYHKVTDQGIDPAWNTSVWPAAFSSVIDETVNGFIMQADFYKFRGRGIIQTTGRSDYIVIVDYILSNASRLNAASLISLKATWEAFPVLVPGTARSDVIASRSTDNQWKTAFSDGAVLAAAVYLDSVGKGNYLQLNHQAATLNGDITTKGSLYYMARKINAGNYPNEVVPMMKAMIRGIANI